MLYHSGIVEPGSGFFLRVILLVSNVGMIFVPFSEKVTCSKTVTLPLQQLCNFFLREGFTLSCLVLGTQLKIHV